MLNFVVAKTHSPDYLLHKYWARKPYNVLGEFISNIAQDRKLRVLDPFCGSGVFAREAACQGHTVFALDINPTACLLTKTTCFPPDPEEFRRVVEPILSTFSQLCNEAFGEIDGDSVRYFVHETLVRCGGCEEVVGSSAATRSGRIYSCESCGERLRFNLKSLVKTRIVGAQTLERSIPRTELADDVVAASEKHIDREFAEYDLSFEENKRILSYAGMHTRDLFTNRNYSLLCWLADQFHAIESEQTRDAALLLLTASAAQCSRLIAYRNNMTTGGPAWSVPGFWVPPTHLETNPSHHVGARYKKFCRGLESLHSRNVTDVSVFQHDAARLSDLDIADIDLVFLDPPYGDSVPYVEFSTMWNSFLKMPVSADADISVSDRNSEKKNSWSAYRTGLQRTIEAIRATLNDSARLLLTFNNHDALAWEALIAALQLNGFNCLQTTYQIPAVVSSKAQFSPDGSYISDIYALFSWSDAPEYTYSYDPVISDLMRCAVSRGGRLTKSQLNRCIFLSLVENNVHHGLFRGLGELTDTYFETKGSMFELREGTASTVETETLADICIGALDQLFKSGPRSWQDVYIAIAKQCADIGIPEPGEVRKVLEDHIVIKGKLCLPIGPGRAEPAQGRLF